MLDARKLWAARNFGIQTEIAAAAGVTKAAVGHILRGERWNETVGRLLAEAGAPGFVFDDAPSANTTMEAARV